MRKIAVLACLLAALSIMTIGAAASSGLALRANIDFPFYFGSQQLPAGEYVIEMRALQGGTASSVLLRKAGRHCSRINFYHAGPESVDRKRATAVPSIW